jgi:hypothetical protein
MRVRLLLDIEPSFEEMGGREIREERLLGERLSFFLIRIILRRVISHVLVRVNNAK